MSAEELRTMSEINQAMAVSVPLLPDLSLFDKTDMEEVTARIQLELLEDPQTVRGKTLVQDALLMPTFLRHIRFWRVYSSLIRGYELIAQDKTDNENKYDSILNQQNFIKAFDNVTYQHLLTGYKEGEEIPRKYKMVYVNFENNLKSLMKYNEQGITIPNMIVILSENVELAINQLSDEKVSIYHKNTQTEITKELALSEQNTIAVEKAVKEPAESEVIQEQK